MYLLVVDVVVASGYHFSMQLELAHLVVSTMLIDCIRGNQLVGALLPRRKPQALRITPLHL